MQNLGQFGGMSAHEGSKVAASFLDINVVHLITAEFRQFYSEKLAVKFENQPFLCKVETEKGKKELKQVTQGYNQCVLVILLYPHTFFYKYKKTRQMQSIRRKKKNIV